jgi:type VI secretion system protein ImpE
MTATPPIAALLDEDRLADALAVALREARVRPQETGVRLLLIDLLILAGDYARADAQCEIAARMAPAEAVGLARLRGLVRGMEARRQWFEAGAVPSFPGGPTPCDEAALRFALALGEGDAAAAAQALGELEAGRAERPAEVDGSAAADLRDGDDRLAHALEAVTEGGAYLWIDWARVASLDVAPPARPRDLAWRRARLTLRDGSAADILLPLVYHAPDQTDAERLGRSTDWREHAGGVVTGRGQRCLLVGEEMLALGQIGRIELARGRDG